ncbi:NACHT domain-containing protein [Streptomyces sp. NPDC102476]|uniref:NACHT domain-containing protein n=1 Tax=Streptomyces sp. NPDC102476 TaxID=3366181 RepID=UPI003814B6AB
MSLSCSWRASGEYLALDGASVVTALGGLLVAMIAATVALFQVQRAQNLEREKIRLETAAQMRLKEQEWEHERHLTERERRRADREAEQERERAAERVAARRSTLDAGAAAYCGRMVQELSTLRILDMSRPLRLERLYVQVGVQEQQPLRFLSADEVDRRTRRLAPDLTRPYREASAEQEHKRRRAEAREAAAEAQAATVHTYAPIDALQRYRRIVVVGDPGAGKTTMLRHLALRMATQAEHETLPELPAYVELFRFVESGHESLLDHLAEQWAEQYGFEDARDYIVERLTDGSAALLLDGLDEVLGGESAQEAESAYRRVTAELARLASRFPRAPIAATCRRQGWRGGLPQFQVLEALDFEWPQIETFVANWFGAADRRRAGLVRALSANGRLQTLAANPLLLSLIAIVYERDLELPERRAALYQRCVEVLLREWDAHRKISRYSRFTTDRKQDLLKEIACHYHQRGLRYFPEDDLLDQIARFLPTIDLAPEDSRAILDEIAAQYGLLKPQAHGWFGFLHLTLQEHFTAAALLERGAEGVRQATAARDDPWWEEVILLLAGVLPDATPLLAGLLQPDNDTGDLLHLAGDDLFHTDLLLAARCLTGSPRIADVVLRRRIVAAVWDLLDRSPHTDEKRRAAEVLVSVLRSDEQTDEIIAYVCDARRADDARLALVEALEAHGGRRVGERLLGAFALCRGEVRQALVTALGTLRVEAAVPMLCDELDRELESVTPGVGDEWAQGRRIGLLVRALGPAGAPTDLFLRVLEECVGLRDHTHALLEDLRDQVEAAVRDALKDRREPGLAERLLAHLDRHPATRAAARAYLNAADDAGIGTLIDRSRAADSGIELLAAVRDHIADGHGHGHREDLLALAHNRTANPRVRTLALGCLDYSPGTPDELTGLLTASDGRVQVSAAVTLAAWGIPVGLDVIRRAVLEGRVEPGQRWGGLAEARDADRLVAVLVPYGVEGIVTSLRAQAEEPGRQGYVSRAWLNVFSPEDAVDHCLRRLESGERLRPYEVPDRVPSSRVQAVFRYFELTPSARFTPRGDYEKLLAAAAAAVENADELACLIRFLPGGDLAGAHFPQAHHHVHQASRRAQVRVLRDGTLHPLTLGRDVRPASPAPPPPE